MDRAAYVLFDLDDTLYPAGAGLMQAISARTLALAGTQVPESRVTLPNICGSV